MKTYIVDVFRIRRIRRYKFFFWIMQTGAQEAEGRTGHFLVYGMEKLSIYGHNGWDEYYDSCMGFSNRSFSPYFPFIFSLSLFERGETEPKKTIFFVYL